MIKLLWMDYYTIQDGSVRSEEQEWRGGAAAQAGSKELGTVLSVHGEIVTAGGLAKVSSGEMVCFPGTSIRGVAVTLNRDTISVCLLDRPSDKGQAIRPGFTIRALGHPLSLLMDRGATGRVLSPLGENLAFYKQADSSDAETASPTALVSPEAATKEEEQEIPDLHIGTTSKLMQCDSGKSPTCAGRLLPRDYLNPYSSDAETPTASPLVGTLSLFSNSTTSRMQLVMPIEASTPGILARQPVVTPLHTGTTAIDALFPIGRGQRQLVIGDRRTGKSSLVLSIVRHNSPRVHCVYACVGQRASSLSTLFERSSGRDADVPKLTVVLSHATDTLLMKVVTPSAAQTMAEFLMHNLSADTVAVYDDLLRHADAYRQLGLLTGMSPGREGYPADMFYTHARLLERAGNFSIKNSGSVTALPVLETYDADITSYIPTNLIGITDGQLFLDETKFKADERPAINLLESVSRLGANVQLPELKPHAAKLKILLARAAEVERYSAFAEDELDADAISMLSTMRIARRILVQDLNEGLSPTYQTILLGILTNPKLQATTLGQINEAECAVVAESAMQLAKFADRFVESAIIPPAKAAECSPDTYLKTHEYFLNKQIVLDALRSANRSLADDISGDELDLRLVSEKFLVDLTSYLDEQSGFSDDRKYLLEGFLTHLGEELPAVLASLFINAEELP